MLLHEFGHGLGFAGFYNKATGAQLAGLPDVFGTYTFNTTLDKRWPQMTDRRARGFATIDTNHVVWDRHQRHRRGARRAAVRHAAASPSTRPPTSAPSASAPRPSARVLDLARHHRQRGRRPRRGGRRRPVDHGRLLAAHQLGHRQDRPGRPRHLRLRRQGEERPERRRHRRARRRQRGRQPAGGHVAAPIPPSPSPRSAISLADGNAIKSALGQRHGQRRRSASTSPSAPAPIRPAARCSTLRTRWSPARRSRTGIRSPSPTC